MAPPRGSGPASVWCSVSLRVCVSLRARFFLNVALVALLVIAALLRLPVFDSVRGRFDVIGAITSTLGMGALVYGVLNVGEHGWMAPQTYVPILAGVVVL